MSKNIATLLEILDSSSPEKIAIAGPELSTTYGDLKRTVDDLAGALLDAGITRGDKVMLVMENGLEFVACFLAVICCGASALAINPSYTAQELTFAIGDAKPRLVIVTDPQSAAISVGKDLDLKLALAKISQDGNVILDGAEKQQNGSGSFAGTSEDIALMLYTSGSTSAPKLVPLSHANLISAAQNFVNCFKLSPADTALVVMPLFHVHGLIGQVLSTLYSGGKIVLPARFSASAFWSLVKLHGVTWYSASPTIHHILLKRAEQDKAPQAVLRFVRSSSAALSQDLRKGMEEKFGTEVIEAFGMTEAANQISANPLSPGAKKPGTCGKGTGVEIAIADDTGNLLEAGNAGEIIIRGAQVMSGYANNPCANASSFFGNWFRTGDQGKLDQDGFLSLSGRLKDLINRGGEKISPMEIDAVLAEHPAVLECIAFGIPDVKYGEEIHAAVRLCEEAKPEDIIHFCAERLASFKVPKKIHIVDSFPKTPTNKIQRQKVAALFKNQ